MLDVLQRSLLDVLWELRNSDISLIIGGGYGLFLKSAYIQEFNFRTLLTERPDSRSTNDLDLFLKPELLIFSGKLKPLSMALKKLGYEVVKTAPKYQFIKTGDVQGGVVKIDFLTGPQSCFTGTKAKADERRVRPNPSVGIHAHPVNEVPTLEKELVKIALKGILSSGHTWECEVYVPHPYSFLMMKLFAFRDRLSDPVKESGRYHAFDLYSIVATTTEKEWDVIPELRRCYKHDSFVKEAGDIVGEYFSAINKLGMIRIRESKYFKSEYQLDDFMAILKETFPR